MDSFLIWAHENEAHESPLQILELVKYLTVTTTTTTGIIDAAVIDTVADLTNTSLGVAYSLLFP